MTYIAIDVGTTNTRVWLLHNKKVLGQVQRPIGVRNSSISGDSTLLGSTLRAAINSVRKHSHSRPRFVLAAGMITSARGLCELPHVVAPGGKDKLSQYVEMRTFEKIFNCPFFLVPGVRINLAPSRLENIEETDIIRGEECEIVGLQKRKALSKPWVFLHLGSHTKAIHINERGQIVRSVSTLSGECFDVLRRQTILSDHLGKLTTKLSKTFFHRGAQLSNRNGLLRALFMVRLLGENKRYSRWQLHSFLLGALLASDLQAMEKRQMFRGRLSRILISGHSQLQKTWALLLRSKHYPFLVVGRPEQEAAFLEGLRTIVFASPVFAKYWGKRGDPLPRDY